ncbi:MAG: NADP-dependent oxidoreductase, partial [Alphaproteobacteria bacterium]
MAKLASRPTGMARRENFEIVDGPVPEPGDGEFRVRVEVVSLDPAMRGWMAEGRSYAKPVQLGEVMRAFGAGYVEASNHRGFPEGAAVTGLFGVQRYGLSDGAGVTRVDPDQAPLERWVGGLGMPGMTAYFGLLKIGQPKEGQTVVVSAASGAVGQIVGQLAKIHGARAIGIAGGEEKCRFITDDLGFDAAIDYKGEDVAERLEETCPDRIDVYYENVGGPVGDACFQWMNYFGRVPFCGLIHYFGQPGPGLSPLALRSILVNRLTVRGFIIFDFAEHY